MKTASGWGASGPGSREASALAAQDAQRIGGWEVLRKLGSGAVGEAVLAVRRDRVGFGQKACLKRVRARERDNPEARQQLETEASVARALRHPNIATLLDFGQDAAGYYLAFEYVEGMDLRVLLRHLGGLGAVLEPPLAVYVAVQLCEALQAAHAAGVVHRDLSPSNVLLSRRGAVKLSDFGIAKQGDGPAQTATGVVKGKIGYLAPEYARTGQAGPQADLYALGVVLYELLTGRRPYESRDPLELLRRASAGEREPLERVKGVSAPLRAVVDRLLSPKPTERYARAGELARDLASLPRCSPAVLGELVARVSRARVCTADELGAGVAETRAYDLRAADVADAEATAGVAKQVSRATLPATAAPADPSEAGPGLAGGVAPQPWHTERVVRGPTLPRRRSREVATDLLEDSAARLQARLGRRGLRAGWRWGGLVLGLCALGLLAPIATDGGPRPHAPSVSGAAREVVMDAALPGAAALSETPPQRPGLGVGPDFEVHGAPRAVEHAALEPPGPGAGQPESLTSPADATRPQVPPGWLAPGQTGKSVAPSGSSPGDPPAPRPARRRMALLKVVVIPFGDVWVDGIHRGVAPVQLQLPAGNHRVRTRFTSGARTHRVLLRAGERRTIVLRRGGLPDATVAP